MLRQIVPQATVGSFSYLSTDFLTATAGSWVLVAGLPPHVRHGDNIMDIHYVRFHYGVRLFLFVRTLGVKILDLLLDRCYEQMFVLCFDHITCGAQNEWGTVDT